VRGGHALASSMTSRFILLSCAVAIGTLLLVPQSIAQTPSSSAAQSYPTRPVRVIVGLAPGGGADIMAREAAQRLTESLGRSFVVDNRPAAGGAIAGELTARAAPDGYTLLLVSASTAVAAVMHEKLSYNVLKDFAPIILMATSPVVLVAHPGVPAKDAKELIALAKSRPGKLSYASSGIGGSTHLVAELFKLAAGVDILHIPYKGTGPALTDLMSGNVDLLFSGAISLLPHIKAQRLRALVVTSARRVPVLPEVPTTNESGLTGAEAYSFYGLVAQAATPREIITKLNQEMGRIIVAPQFKERLAADGANEEGGTPEHFGQFLREVIGKWQRVVKHAKIKAQ
jgi:tripartite-type tricarboxylate transporter receptor subunit TctC